MLQKVLKNTCRSQEKFSGVLTVTLVVSATRSWTTNKYCKLPCKIADRRTFAAQSSETRHRPRQQRRDLLEYRSKGMRTSCSYRCRTRTYIARAKGNGTFRRIIESVRGEEFSGCLRDSWLQYPGMSLACAKGIEVTSGGAAYLAELATGVRSSQADSAEQ